VEGRGMNKIFVPEQPEHMPKSFLQQNFVRCIFLRLDKKELQFSNHKPPNQQTFEPPF
jgi:hypothetical protein